MTNDETRGRLSPAELSETRRDYALAALDEKSVSADPFQQFQTWFAEARASEMIEPNAMSLSTVSADGSITSRIVLLKEFSTEGFVFFTNYESQKGLAIAYEPKVALLFYWPELERQIRIEGIAEKTTAEVSDTYFATRPLKSQISAIVSPQSQVVMHRSKLEEDFIEAEKRFSGRVAQQVAERTPSRPTNWGGYAVKPKNFEFWQGRRSRLHDRVQYQYTDGRWQITRLAP